MRYTKTNNCPHFFLAITALTFFLPKQNSLENGITESKRQNSLILKVKSEFKGQIVSKFDLGQINAYKPMYFDRNISEKGSYLSCVTNCEFHFITNLLIMNSTTTKFYTYSTKICTSGIRTSGDGTSGGPPVCVTVSC